jgi:hypothetical protein
MAEKRVKRPRAWAATVVFHNDAGGETKAEIQIDGALTTFADFVSKIAVEGGVLYVRAGVVSVYRCNWGGAARVSGRVANRCLCRLQRDGVVISENSGGALHVLDEARFNERLLIFKAESTRCAFVVRPRGGGASSAPPPDLLVSLVMPRDVDLAEAMRLAGRKTHEHGMFYESKDETSFIVPPVFVEIAGPLYHRTEGWQSLCVLRRS